MAKSEILAPSRDRQRRLLGAALAGPALFGAAAVAGGLLLPGAVSTPAVAEASKAKLPAPPAGGVMGFVVDTFVPAMLEGTDACPEGPAMKMRDAYLATLPAAERERLMLPVNQEELKKKWQATGFGPGETNVCSQPERFDRPMLRTVQSKRAIGVDLDGDGLVKSCEHQSFVGPGGEQGIDNQAYRALGCKLEWRGADGRKSDNSVGMRQFFASGEWTQVILLRGVDSLENDGEVEVIYGNTPDRPMTDSKGRFLPGASFAMSDTLPRHRNVLKGRIVGGVLTTYPADIVLTQTWGQGGARDIRGNRTTFDMRSGRIKLAFQPDGSMRGVLGGYQPVFDLIQSPALGGGGAVVDGGIDCAAELKTLKALADGIPDPKTGKCTAVSNAFEVSAVPAFVNDVPPTRTAAQ
ncbi:MAG: hypothetical protein ABW203_04645 [Novosphingobium sp.]